TIDAPSAVIVPDTLMIGRSPSRRRMSGWCSDRGVTGSPPSVGSMVLQLDAPEKRAEPLVDAVHQDLERRAGGLDPAAVHEDDPRGDVPRERHLMGDYDHGHAVGGQLPHHRQHLADELGVEGRGDLVEQQHLGLHGHRPGDAHALLLATRQLDGKAVELVGEADPGEPALPCPASVVAGEAAHLTEPEHHVLERAEMWEEVEQLEHHADVGADPRELPIAAAAAAPLRAVAEPDLHAVDLDRPGVVGLQEVDAPEERRLAAPRRSDHHDDLALADVEVDTVEHGVGTEGLPQVADPDEGDGAGHLAHDAVLVARLAARRASRASSGGVRSNRRGLITRPYSRT